MTSSAPDGSNAFGGYAADYAARRPGYPDAVFDALFAALGGPRGLAIELGAGSGQATKVLATKFDKVAAVEPDARMIAAMPAIVNVEKINTSAEGAAFDEESADAVVAATAFHWMDQARVTANAYRWLRPGGVFFPFLYDAMKIDGAAGEVLSRHEVLWAPFKDRRLTEAVDYAGAVLNAGLFAKVTAFESRIEIDMAPNAAASLLGTASFVNAYVNAIGADIADYIDQISSELSAYGSILKVFAPISGAIAVK